MYHSFLIHSSADGHLGCFHVLAIIKQRHYFAYKFCLVKAMVFPVVMYRYESWTIKNAECRRIDGFEFVVLKKTLESPLNCEEIQPVNPKGNQS